MLSAVSSPPLLWRRARLAHPCRKLPFVPSVLESPVFRGDVVVDRLELGRRYTSDVLASLFTLSEAGIDLSRGDARSGFAGGTDGATATGIQESLAARKAPPPPPRKARRARERTRRVRKSASGALTFRFTASTDRGVATMEASMRQATRPPEGWGLVLEGRNRDLTLRLLLFRGGEPRNEIGVEWSYRPTRGSARGRLAAAAFVDVLTGQGRLIVEDRNGNIPTADLNLAAQARDPEIAVNRALFADVALLEEWLGIDIPLPRTASSDEVQEVAAAASMVRARQAPIMWESLAARLLPDADPIPLGTVQRLWFEIETELVLFGTSRILGTTAAEYEVVALREEAEADGERTVWFGPASNEAAHVVAELLPPSGGDRKRSSSDAYAIERHAVITEPAALRRDLIEALGPRLVGELGVDRASNDALMIVRRAWEAQEILRRSFDNAVARRWWTGRNPGLGDDTPTGALRAAGTASERNLVVSAAREFGGR